MKSVLCGITLLAFLAGSAVASILPEGLTATEHRAYVLVGDKDDFHAGDPSDIAPASPLCEEIIARSTRWGNLGEPVDLDEGGFDRAVGVTFYAGIPADARITKAVMNVRFRGTQPLVWNDHFRLTHDQFPLVAFKDILGFEPTMGNTYVARIDLLNVPVRNRLNVENTHWMGGPDAYRTLAPQILRTGQVDAVFMDDLAIDWAEVIVEYQLGRGVGGGGPGGGYRDPVLICSCPAGGDDFGFTFVLPRSSPVDLAVFDVTGRKVAQVLSRVMSAGSGQASWSARGVSPGVYFARLRTADAERTVKIVHRR